MKTKIPADQAAYQKGRSTTEQVFCLKVLIEKAIISQDYNVIIMMIDMSKAFDTVSRSRLMEQLGEILEENEMRMMYLLINGVKLKVRIGNQLGEWIKTNIGVCQGDCLSALLFIFFLAHILKPFPKGTNKEDHILETFWSDLDWMINRDKINLKLDPKYADDITYIRSHISEINKIKRILPSILAEGNLIENKSKREEYYVPGSGEKWKACKCLGSFIDTEMDIQNRKRLAIGTMKTLNQIVKSRTISKNTKIRIFESYISSVFLYNSELWVVTKTVANKIDSFQRRQLRHMLNIKWPKVVTNEEIYRRTKVKKWSYVIKKRRLSWLVHLLRLSIDTPARKALNESIKKHPRNVGGSQMTWIDLVKKDLKNGGPPLNFNDDVKLFNELTTLCQDRNKWRNQVKHMMLIDSTYM